MQPSLRHLRMFDTLARTHSVTRAAEACFVSQPAVTQAIRKLEAEAGMALFTRGPDGIFPNEAGEVFARRVRRALQLLDAAVAEMNPAIRSQATRAQLSALIAVSERQSFTLAAQQMALAQPTVHRSVALLEQAAGVQFFQRSAQGLTATRAARGLAQAARLAFVELDQAASELAALAGREVGRIVIGSLPLSRSGFLPRALLDYRRKRPGIGFEVIDGRYDELLGGLRRGEIDLVIGALRHPSPLPEILQEPLFTDSAVIVARRGHPLENRPGLTARQLSTYPWVMPRATTPLRAALDEYFGDHPPRNIIETSSVIMMREILRDSDHLGGLSRMQAETGAEAQVMAILPVDLAGSSRSIGLTTRRDWEPTPVQQEFLEVLRQSASELDQG